MILDHIFDYFKKQNKSDLAKKSGLNRNTVNRIAYGQKNFEIGSLEKIVNTTGHEVEIKIIPFRNRNMKEQPPEYPEAA